MEGPFELENSIDIELIDASVCSGFKVSAESCSILATNASQLLGVDYQGKNCVLLVTKSSSCKGSFNVENSFNASALISSQIIVFGGAMPSASIEVKEEGQLNMVQTEVRDMNVDLEGASEATVNVSETIWKAYFELYPILQGPSSDSTSIVRKIHNSFHFNFGLKFAYFRPRCAEAT